MNTKVKVGLILLLFIVVIGNLQINLYKRILKHIRENQRKYWKSCGSPDLFEFLGWRSEFLGNSSKLWTDIMFRHKNLPNDKVLKKMAITYRIRGIPLLIIVVILVLLLFLKKITKSLL